jgi:hypothetical protein
MRTGRYKFVTSALLFFEGNPRGICVVYAHETRMYRKIFAYPKDFFVGKFDLRIFYA